MACLHCADDVWGDPKNDLTLEEIEKFSLGLGTVESVALGGGEPFLRNDLSDICRLFVKNNRVTSIGIPSNGFAPGTICTAVQSILETCPELTLSIMLSLDGFQETHDAIRTAGSFTKVLETAQKLKALASDFPRLGITFNTTVNNNNWKELPALAQFVQSEFHSRLEFNIIAGNPRDPAFTVPARKDLEQTLDGLLDAPNASLKRRIYNRLYRDILLQTNCESRQAIPCRAGSLVCLIDANGDVRSCPMLPPLGNIRNSTFNDIWQNEAAIHQYNSIIAGNCSCNNDCFVRISLENYWKLPFLMLQNLGNLRRQ